MRIGWRSCSAYPKKPESSSPDPAGSNGSIPTAAAAATAAQPAVVQPGASSSSSHGQQQADVNLAGQLLGCFGDLFTASLDVGWKSEPEADGTKPAKCMLTVANNDITRVRADVESLMFQSSVSPKLAVKMLYAVVANIMLRFYSEDSFQLRFWHQLFTQLYEYLGKESLDVTACLSAHAEVLRPPAQARQPPGSSQAAASSVTAAMESKLRVVLNGGSSSQGLGHVYPFSLVNDINLLTVLDSFKLFGEKSGGGSS